MKQPYRPQLSLQEQLCAVLHEKNQLTIALPRESDREERRFALTPEGVAQLVEAGHRVVMQNRGGWGINYSDLLYAEAGAELVEGDAEAWDGDIVVRMQPPTLAQCGLIRRGATLITLLQLHRQRPEIVHELCQQRVTALAFDRIRNEEGHYPFADLLEEVDGNAAVVVASGLMTNQQGGKGILMGSIPGVPPTEVIVLGAGLSGCAAARAAMALGATVKMFDNRIELLRKAKGEVQGLNYVSNLHPQVIARALKSADVVIGTRSLQGAMLSESDIEQMKKGALLIDLCTEQGGCFETTVHYGNPHNRIFEKYGVLHHCLASAGSVVARTASMALSNLFVPLLLGIGEGGGTAQCLHNDLDFRKAVYLYNSKVVSRRVSQACRLPYHDISLYFSLY